MPRVMPWRPFQWECRGSTVHKLPSLLQARADMRQEKVDGFNFNEKKRLRPTLSNESLTQATQSIVAASPVPESVPGSARASNGSLLETKPLRMWMLSLL